jgi:CheY-like chemotaxis protein
VATVLIVDDQVIISFLLAAALADVGHDTLVANTGSEGIRHINKGCPHLVISDHMMPGIDGIALLTALRGHPTCSAVPSY